MNIAPSRDSFGPIAIEGAVDYACGRPRDANPYADELPNERRDWNAGWGDAASLSPPVRLERNRRWWRGKQTP